MKGLEDKLVVKTGDLITLKGSTWTHPRKGDYDSPLEITGYVVNYCRDTVKISQAKPGKKPPGFSSSCEGYRKGFFSGDKTYFLAKFKSYEVIKSNNPSKK